MQRNYILEKKFRKEVANITKKYKGQLEMNYKEEIHKCECCNKKYKTLTFDIEGLEFIVKYQDYFEVEYLHFLPSGKGWEVSNFQTLVEMMNDACTYILEN